MDEEVQGYHGKICILGNRFFSLMNYIFENKMIFLT